MHAFWVVLCKARLRLFEKSLCTRARAHAHTKKHAHSTHARTPTCTHTHAHTTRECHGDVCRIHTHTHTHTEAHLSCTHAERGHSERDGHIAWWIVCRESVPRKASSQTVLLLLFAMFAMGPLHKENNILFVFVESADNLGRRQQACQSLAVYYTSLVQT
jgi:hypothetical protein